MKAKFIIGIVVVLALAAAAFFFLRKKSPTMATGMGPKKGMRGGASLPIMDISSAETGGAFPSELAPSAIPSVDETFKYGFDSAAATYNSIFGGGKSVAMPPPAPLPRSSTSTARKGRGAF